MSVRMASVQIVPSAVLPIVNGTETILATVGPINPPLDNAPVFLFWYLNILMGNVTGLNQIRIRRGSLITSPLVNPLSAGVTALLNSVNVLSGFFVDLPGVAAALTYSVTVNQTGAGSNGQLNEGSFMALCL